MRPSDENGHGYGPTKQSSTRGPSFLQVAAPAGIASGEEDTLAVEEGHNQAVGEGSCTMTGQFIPR